MRSTVGRELRVNVKFGTVLFSLDASQEDTGVSCELVNEGFGVSQLVHLLARCADRQMKIVCIEEPEIHLHPSAVRSLARSLSAIAKQDRKHFVISTHSESLLTGFLAEVARGHLAAGFHVRFRDEFLREYLSNPDEPAR
ncbi:MAG: AAA family ATPase [Phycisphaerae bacterium]